MIRRDVTAIAVVMIMILSAVPALCTFDSDAVPTGRGCDGVLIYEATTKYGDDDRDGFSLKNYGTTTVDLDGYYLRDVDGDDSKHTFTIEDVSLAPGKVVAFVHTDDGSWFCQTTGDRAVYEMNAKGVKGSAFTFTNGGDFIHLYKPDGTLLDTVVFGKPSRTPTFGWSGQGVDMGNMEEAVRRVEPKDTDTYFDWIAAGPEMTSNSFYDVPTITGAKVTPFVFPEAKGRSIFDAVMGAETSVYISIYMLTSKEMISELAYLANHGVEVKVMLENKPLGYSHSYPDLKVIDNASKGSVCFIGYDSNKEDKHDVDRYSYVHNKYAIIDGKKVIVTSENWTGPNLGASKGNRGWGAVIESTQYASYMTSYFNNDIKGAGTEAEDICTFAEYEAANGAVTPSADLPTHPEVESYVNALPQDTQTFTDVSLRMYMSPDNTFKALQYYIDNATTRVYTEQMDVGKSFENLDNLSPVSAMASAAFRGVDARLLLFADDGAEFLEKLNTTTNIKAGKMSVNSYMTMHNKGVIIDDAVWLSSVNWTENAFMNNRECGLYIMSPEVTEFFVDAYNIDWAHDYTSTDVLTVVPDFREDGSVTFTAKSGTGTVGVCSWSLEYDDGTTETRDSTDGTLVVEDYTKLSSVRVTVDSNTTGRFVFSYAPPADDRTDDPISIEPEVAVAAGAGLSLFAIIVLALKKFFGKGGKKKGKKGSSKGSKKSSSSRKK